MFSVLKVTRMRLLPWLWFLLCFDYNRTWTSHDFLGVKCWVNKRVSFQNLLLSLFFSFAFCTPRCQMFFKIGILKTFAIFTRKHLCWRLFLIRLQSRRSAILLKRDSKYCEIFKNTFFTEHLRWLLLLL